MEKDPVQAPLDGRGQAMVAAVKTLDTVNKEDEDRLHDLGRADSDTMDAMAHATNMIGAGILMKRPSKWIRRAKFAFGPVLLLENKNQARLTVTILLPMR